MDSSSGISKNQQSGAQLVAGTGFVTSGYESASDKTVFGDSLPPKKPVYDELLQVPVPSIIQKAEEVKPVQKEKTGDIIKKGLGNAVKFLSKGMHTAGAVSVGVVSSIPRFIGKSIGGLMGAGIGALTVASPFLTFIGMSKIPDYANAQGALPVTIMTACAVGFVEYLCLSKCFDRNFAQVMAKYITFPFRATVAGAEIGGNFVDNIGSSLKHEISDIMHKS